MSFTMPGSSRIFWGPWKVTAAAYFERTGLPVHQRSFATTEVALLLPKSYKTGTTPWLTSLCRRQEGEQAQRQISYLVGPHQALGEPGTGGQEHRRKKLQVAFA